MHGVGRNAVQITKETWAIQEGDESHIAKELLLFRELPNWSIEAIVKDDAMIPILYPGNYIGGIIAKNIENAIGKECIIIDEKR